MTNQHPITPPLELVQQWLEKARREIGTIEYNPMETFYYGATQAAQWGADQELGACAKWLDRNNQWAKVDIDELRDARRPKPPSLKEQALTALSHLLSGSAQTLDTTEAEFYIRRALEALPND